MIKLKDNKGIQNPFLFYLLITIIMNNIDARKILIDRLELMREYNQLDYTSNTYTIDERYIIKHNKSNGTLSMYDMKTTRTYNRSLDIYTRLKGVLRLRNHSARNISNVIWDMFNPVANLFN